MEKLVWHFSTSGGLELFGPLLVPMLLGLALYYSSYVPIFVRIMARRAMASTKEPRLVAPPDALVVLPTLLRRRQELEGLQRAVTSVLENGYPGRLVVCAAVDDLSRSPGLVSELERWSRELTRPANTRLMVAGTPRRAGKAMAIEAGVNAVRDAVARGELDCFPDVFFNMDADSELSDDALERMVFRMTRRKKLFRERPMIVASNVCVRRSHYWRGWRYFFTVRGQLSLQVAREYMTSISVARHNIRLMPVTSVSGALYCTWSELFLQAPRYAAFVRTLRFWHLLRWWLGGAPPSFERSRVRPRPEAMIGPGDDTWIAWLAMSARWQRGRVSLELPRTPLHALWHLIRGYLSRPIAYDPAAKIYTATPSSAKGLFRQRIRWNSSRVWLLNRFGWSTFFQWSLGAIVYLDIVILLALHGVILAALVLWPLVDRPADWLAVLIIVNVGYALVRAGATFLAMLQDDDIAGQWRKLLALPLSGPYHLVFNILTTIVGLTKDLLLFGVNTNFAPEETLIAAGTGRIAVLYRLRRAFLLAVHSAWYGDIPFGRFWFGWQETPWTPNGYRGWTSGERPSPVRRPRSHGVPRAELTR